MIKLSPYLLLSIILLSTSCSNIRLRYDGEFRSENGTAGRIRFERSYAVGNGLKTLCWITGWVYGGFCWGYFLLPNGNQKKSFTGDINAYLMNYTRDAKTVIASPENIQRISWDDEEDKIQVFSTPNNRDSSSKKSSDYHSKPKTTTDQHEFQESSEFLR